MIQIYRQIILSTFLLFSIVSGCIGQSDTSKRALLDSTSLNIYDQKIILCEADSLVVITTRQIFELQFHQWMREDPDILDDQQLFNAIFSKTMDKSVNVVQVANDLKLIDRLKFMVADLLENGSCIIYNKRTKRLENHIQTTAYSTVGFDGRQFIVGNKIILQTIDRIW